jgi:hypothetical protein
MLLLSSAYHAKYRRLGVPAFDCDGPRRAGSYLGNRELGTPDTQTWGFSFSSTNKSCWCSQPQLGLAITGVPRPLAPENN